MTNYPNLQGKRVSTTYGGILHLPHSLTGFKDVVYDGKGTPTSLTIGGIGQGVDISGNLSAADITSNGNLTTTGNATIGGTASIVGNINLNGGGNINDVTIGEVGSVNTLIAPNNTEVGKLKIRDTTGDYEVAFGNNLFTIAVKNGSGNNLFIKNNYTAADNLSPFWINKSTGEVNIGSLNSNSITNTGNLINRGTLTVDSNGFVAGNFTVGGDIPMTGGGKINDIEVGAVGATKTLIAPNNTEVGKLRVRQTAGDYEVLFGDDPTNLFSIIVKKGSGNNLYIKNNYSDADNTSPLWIDKATGQVNIRNLNVSTIATVPPPGVTVPVGQPANRNSNIIPVGMIGTFPSLIIPDGWLLCNGDFKSKTIFPELFTYLQYSYGGGGDNFGLPDYRELFLRGWGGNRGIDSTANRNPGSRQNDAIINHHHILNIDAIYSTRNDPPNDTVKRLQGDPDNVNTTTMKNATSDINDVDYISDVRTSASVETSTETRPENIAVVYCIKW